MEDTLIDIQVNSHCICLHLIFLDMIMFNVFFVIYFLLTGYITKFKEFINETDVTAVPENDGSYSKVLLLVFTINSAYQYSINEMTNFILSR